MMGDNTPASNRLIISLNQFKTSAIELMNQINITRNIELRDAAAKEYADILKQLQTMIVESK